VLAGLLECGRCGGSFHALDGSGKYGCSWRRNRGETICPGEPLFVPRTALEERISGALREQVLTPDHIGYAVERALGLAAAALRRPAAPVARLSASARRRVAEIDEDLAALRRVGDRTGRSVAALVAELQAERGELLAAAADKSPARPAVDVERLRPVIEARVREVRAAFDGAPDQARAALHGLLADQRIPVHPDAERGFRVGPPTRGYRSK
jgi:hypothetical protein